MDQLSTDRYLQAVADDAAALVAAARRVSLDAPVATCGDWTMRDLVVHTGIVHRHKTQVVAEGWLDEAPPESPEPAGDPLPWFEQGVAELLDVLSTTDLSGPIWSWSRFPQQARWWARRMAHETVIHRVDAELAAGELAPTIDADVAADGVDELIVEMITDGPNWSTVVPSDRVIELVTGDKRWVLRTAVLSGTSPTTGTSYEDEDTFVMDAGAPPDASIRTDASTLDLWVWGRGQLPADAASGDTALVERVRRVAAESTR